MIPPPPPPPTTHAQAQHNPKYGPDFYLCLVAPVVNLRMSCRPCCLFPISDLFYNAYHKQLKLVSMWGVQTDYIIQIQFYACRSDVALQTSCLKFTKRIFKLVEYVSEGLLISPQIFRFDCDDSEINVFCFLWQKQNRSVRQLVKRIVLLTQTRRKGGSRGSKDPL